MTVGNSTFTDQDYADDALDAHGHSMRWRSVSSVLKRGLGP